LEIIRSLGSVAAVACASVSHEDRLLLDNVTTLAMGGTRINGVLVIETSADGIALDDLIAHVGTGGGWRAKEQDRAAVKSETTTAWQTLRTQDSEG
jgi:hypothetical protein